jgi:hypothetical protein
MKETGTVPTARPSAHDWLRQVRVAWVPGRSSPCLDRFATELLECFHQMGHNLLQEAGEAPDVALTTAPRPLLGSR